MNFESKYFLNVLNKFSILYNLHSSYFSNIDLVVSLYSFTLVVFYFSKKKISFTEKLNNFIFSNCNIMNDEMARMRK